MKVLAALKVVDFGFAFELGLGGNDFCEDLGVTFRGLGERFAVVDVDVLSVLSLLSLSCCFAIVAGDCARDMLPRKTGANSPI